MSKRISANAAKLEELEREERQLTAEIDQRETRRRRVRQTLERVRLALAGQQILPNVEGVDPDVKAPKPALSRKLSPLQWTVLNASAEEARAARVYVPASPETKRSASSLERAGLVEIGIKGDTKPTPAGFDLYFERNKQPKAAE